MTDFGGAVQKRDDYRFALLGVPFDEKSCFMRGPAKGPGAIREASTGEAINAWTELGCDLEKDTVLADLGDVDVKGNFKQVFKRVEEQVEDILAGKAFPVVLGGDHSVTLPVVRAAAKTFRPLDILHFDAHPDLYDEMEGDRYSHACPFTRILEEGLVENLVQVGVRTVNGEQRKNAEKFGVRMIEMKDFSDNLVLKFDHPLYISFDIDALDPAFAPGVSHHEAGGLTTREALRVIHSLKADIIGLDVVEVNPERDGSGITAAAAVKIIKEVIGKACKPRLHHS